MAMNKKFPREVWVALAQFHPTKRWDEHGVGPNWLMANFSWRGEVLTKELVVTRLVHFKRVDMNVMRVTKSACVVKCPLNRVTHSDVLIHSVYIIKLAIHCVAGPLLAKKYSD